MKAKHIYITLFIFTILTGITYSWILKKDASNRNYTKTSSQINQLIQAEITLDQNVIKSSSSLSTSYDPIVKSSNRIQEIQESLKNNTYLKNFKKPDLEPLIDDIIKLNEQKIMLIEQFKSSNSILRNSIKSLPIITQEIEKENSINFGKLYEHELIEIFKYNNSPDLERKNALLGFLNELEYQGSSQPEKLQAKLRLFYHHSKIILQLRGSNDRIIEDILAIDSGKKRRELLSVYNESFQKNNARTSFIVNILYLVSFILFVIVLWSAIKIYQDSKKLAKLNVSLESKVKERTKELQTKNKHILDSINYAKHIQNAIIPKVEEIRKVSAFDTNMLYLPKDGVSGDFPFFIKKGDYSYYAAVDCTGHGVPGAMMSIISYLSLKEILNTDHTPSCAEVLNTLHERIVHVLKQKDEKGALRDGLDIALCRINTTLNEFQFSGAKRPLYLMRNGELIQHSGDRISIGGYRKKEQLFTDHSIEIQKGDSMYIFSDGYPDQFGEIIPKKIGPKKIRDLVTTNHDQGVEKNIEELSNLFHNWKGNEVQTDDVILIGIGF